jgi:hypothetical protein
MALLSLLRVLPGEPAVVRASLEAMDLEVLLDEARLHGLTGLLRYELAHAGVTLPKAESERLAREALGHAGGTLRTKALLARALGALEDVNVHPVVLKGYPLGARLYPEPLLRPTTDVDLLVEDEQVPRASAALRALGLKSLDAPAEAYHRLHHHHVTFGGEQGAVELHFRLLTGFGAALAAEEALARAQPFDLEGRTVHVLAPDDEVLYLAVHAANHLFSRLAWLYDVKLLLGQSPVDWDQVVARARAAGLQGPAGVAFHLLRRALAAEVPPGVDAALGMGPWHATLASQVFCDRRLEQAPWLGRKWTCFALTTVLTSTPGALLRFTGHHTVRGVKRRLARRFPEMVPPAWGG